MWDKGEAAKATPGLGSSDEEEVYLEDDDKVVDNSQSQSQQQQQQQQPTASKRTRSDLFSMAWAFGSPRASGQDESHNSRTDDSKDGSKNDPERYPTQQMEEGTPGTAPQATGQTLPAGDDQEDDIEFEYANGDGDRDDDVARRKTMKHFEEAGPAPENISGPEIDPTSDIPYKDLEGQEGQQSSRPQHPAAQDPAAAARGPGAASSASQRGRSTTNNTPRRKVRVLSNPTAVKALSPVSHQPRPRSQSNNPFYDFRWGRIIAFVLILMIILFLIGLGIGKAIAGR